MRGQEREVCREEIRRTRKQDKVLEEGIGISGETSMGDESRGSVFFSSFY